LLKASVKLGSAKSWPGIPKKLAEIHPEPGRDADQAGLAIIGRAKGQRLGDGALGRALRKDVGVVAHAIGGRHEDLILAVVEHEEGAGAWHRQDGPEEQEADIIEAAIAHRLGKLVVVVNYCPRFAELTVKLVGGVVGDVGWRRSSGVRRSNCRCSC